MMINIVDHSQELLAVLKDPHAAEADKMAAFELLLSQKNGWWGDGPLMKFAKATARGYVRRKLAPHRLSTDLVDWEGLADESVMVLYRSAGTIHGDPRSWLVGVIHNLINAEIRNVSKTSVDSCGLQRTPENSQNALSGWDSNS